jgi:hypothetical protein
MMSPAMAVGLVQHVRRATRETLPTARGAGYAYTQPWRAVVWLAQSCSAAKPDASGGCVLRRVLVPVVLVGVLIFAAVISGRTSSAGTTSDVGTAIGVVHSSSTVEAGFATSGFLQTGKLQGSHPRHGQRSRRSRTRWMPECALDARPTTHTSVAPYFVVDKPTYKGRCQSRTYTPPDSINA